MSNQIDFSKAPLCYWSNKTKMEYLQRRIIVYSILYYNKGISLVSDSVFDGISRQLVRMSEKYPEDYEKTKYHYVMYDFDGSTGFYLFPRLNKYDSIHLVSIAEMLIKQKRLN